MTEKQIKIISLILGSLLSVLLISVLFSILKVENSEIKIIFVAFLSATHALEISNWLKKRKKRKK
jgi:hypothetical protein